MSVVHKVVVRNGEPRVACGRKSEMYTKVVATSEDKLVTCKMCIRSIFNKREQVERGLV